MRRRGRMDPRGSRATQPSDRSAPLGVPPATWLAQAAEDLRQVGDPQQIARLAVLRARAGDRPGTHQSLRDLRAALNDVREPAVRIYCEIMRIETLWRLGQGVRSRRDAARLETTAEKDYAHAASRGRSEWTLSALAHAYARVGDVNGVNDALDRMRRLGIRTDETVRTLSPLLPLAEARAILTRFSTLSGLELLDVQLEVGDIDAARRTVEGFEDARTRPQGHLNLAHAALDHGDSAGAARDLAVVVNLRTKVGRGNAELLVEVVEACVRLGDERGRRRALQTALAELRRTTNWGARAYASAHLASLCDGPERRDLFRRALAVQRDIAEAGDPWGASFVAKVIAQHQLRAGDLAGARRTRTRVSHPDLATMLTTSIVEFHLTRRKFDAARDEARGAMSESRPRATSYPRLAASTLLPALARIAHEQARAGELVEVACWVNRLRSPLRRAATRMAVAAALLGLRSDPWNP